MGISLAHLAPSAGMVRKLVGLTILAGIGIGAYSLGRQGAISQAKAQPAPIVLGERYQQTSNSDYGKRVVAYIYKNIPITREELGEYLIARAGAEKLELLINRKIVDMACQSRGIVITDAEVNRQVQEDVQKLGAGITIADFERQILKRFNKTMFEWREDVVRPQLAMARLAKSQVVINADDLHKSFEANYGPKVECRMIVMPKEEKLKSWTAVHSKVVNNESEFNEFARKQYIPDLAARGGQVPPIHKNFPDKNLEVEAFSLKPGQVSKIIEMPDGTGVILRCEKHLGADTSVRFEDVRAELHRQMEQIKLNQKIQEVFQSLRAEARPVNLLSSQVRQQDLEHAVHRELSGAPNRSAGTGVQPTGGMVPNNREMPPAPPAMAPSGQQPPQDIGTIQPPPDGK